MVIPSGKASIQSHRRQGSGSLGVGGVDGGLCGVAVAVEDEGFEGLAELGFPFVFAGA